MATMVKKNHSYSVALKTWIVLAAILASAPTVQAQQTQDKGTYPYIAAVAQDEVYIRSGNADGIYPLGKAKKGELVKVTGQKEGYDVVTIAMSQQPAEVIQEYADAGCTWWIEASAPFGKTIDDMRKKIAYVPQKDDVDWNFPAQVMDIVLMGRYPHKKIFKSLDKKDNEIAI